MKPIYKIADVANTILMILAGLAALLMILSGFYVLNDIYYTNRTAFVSYDLLKYRPVPKKDGDNDTQSLAELQEINPDTVGWIELFGTHINYPVMYGKDNSEYLNKDIFGYPTLSGSIYLSAENNSSFNDWYNIIYGHHMDNGAMFGDIEKYLDPDFFSEHSEGILQTDQGDYNIRIVACVRTNAYEDTVYRIQNSAEEQYPQLYDYIMKNYININQLPETIDNNIQLLGLSTCSNAVTDGRIVLFASVSPWDEKINGSIEEKITYVSGNKFDDDTPLSLIAKGHLISNGKWSVLNLLCVLCTFLTLLPLWSLRSKFRQFSYSKLKINELEENNGEDNGGTENEIRKQIISDLKYFIKKGRAGLIIEFLIFLISAIVFILTEDLKGRMGICDKWTGLMIIIAFSALTADFICLRYRGIRPDIETDAHNDD